MPIDNPDAAQLLGTVSEFLERQVLPTLEGRLAFDTRVGINALNIVLRELQHGPQLDGAEISRLEALLGCRGSLEELNRRLCERITAGEIGIESPALVGHLYATALGRLQIDNPRYSTYLALQMPDRD